ADDVRSVGRRAARLAEGQGTDNGGAGVAAGAILLASDLGPADVAELDEDVGGVALAAGGPTARAAIVARSLGLPVGVGGGGDRRALSPVLEVVTGRLATVRVLDFGADKTPPFLDGTAERGMALLLGHPGALAAQLRAILAAGRHAELRILLPLVEAVEQVQAV